MTLADRIHRRLMHEMARIEPRNMKVMRRLVENIRHRTGHGRHYQLNSPYPGAILVRAGERSIIIDAGGYMRWSR